MPISWNSHFQISLDFCDRWAKNCRDKASIRCFEGSPLIRGNKRNMDQQASTKHRMEGFSFTILHLSVAKIKWNLKMTILRNGHRIKITQTKFNDLGIIHFWGEMLYLMMLKYITLLARKVLKIRRSAFLGGHPVYRVSNLETAWSNWDLGRGTRGNMK